MVELNERAYELWDRETSDVRRVQWTPSARRQILPI